jgi:hypothetical protein
MSQRDIVLQMLEQAGERGVHSVDIRRAYIANPSQRIIELEERGHSIRAVRERSPYGTSMGVRYFLVGVSGAASTPDSPSRADSKPTGAAPETSSLFEMTGSPFDAWEAA